MATYKNLLQTTNALNMASSTFFCFSLKYGDCMPFFPEKKILWTVCSTPPPTLIFGRQVAKIRHKKKGKKKTPLAMMLRAACNAYFHQHHHLPTFLKHSWRARIRSSLWGRSSQSSWVLKKKNANAKHTFIVMKRRRRRRRRICLFSRDPAASWCIFRLSFCLSFQLQEVHRSLSVQECPSEWGDGQAQDATCCEDRAYDGCLLLLLLLRLHRRRAAGEPEGAGAVSISSSSSWIPRKRRLGLFQICWAIGEVCKKSRSSSLGTSESCWRTWCSSNSSL